MAKNNDYDYNDLLDRARKGLPTTITEHERFQVPEVELLIEGKNTVFRNFGDIIDMIERDPKHLFLFLLRELGTAGEIDGRRVIFKGQVSSAKLEDRLNSYMETFVICSECKKPDTKLVKEGRTLLLSCTACGATRSIKSKKAITSSQSSHKSFEVGKQYTLLIMDVSNRGDGVAKQDGYIIFVPNSTKGEQVKVEVVNIHESKVFTKKIVE